MNNTSMKNVIMGSVLAVVAVSSLPANASSFCAGGAAATSTVTAASNSSGFVKVAFTPKCSANVFLDGVDASATAYTVGSASSKGKNRFNGSSIGGAVGNAGACTQGTGGACAAGDSSAAAGLAPST